MNLKTRIGVRAIAVSLGARGAVAQHASVHDRLVSTTPAALARLGASVALDGDLLAAGAPGESSTGRVYLWRRIGTDWSLEDRLQGSDQSPSAESGVVALSGDTLAVGAPGQHSGGVATGAVYVFVRTGGVWLEQQKLVAGDGTSGDAFGASLGLSGDTLVVGASHADGLAPESGAVYVFTRSGSTWTEVTKVVAPDGGASNRFGTAVALGGTTLVVGAPRTSLLTFSEGAAYVFDGAGAVWSFQQKLVANDATELDRFGASVDVHGDRAAIGADTAGPSLADQPGAAYVFERSAGTWSQSASLRPSHQGTADEFGCSLDLQGDVVAIGARGENAVYLYRWIAGSWVKLQRSESQLSQYEFGHDVAFDGSSLAVGAPGEGGIGIPSSGAVRTYRVDDSFGAFCFGDGSGTDCPCSNTSNPGHERGCRHSGSNSARLLVGGIPSVSADSVVLYGYEMRATLAVFVQGSSLVNLGLGAVYGDGLRCAAPPIVRLGSAQNTAQGASTYPSSTNPIPISVRGGVSPGQVKTYQIVFRDNAPGFCPTGNLNTTNVIQVVWEP